MRPVTCVITLVSGLCAQDSATIDLSGMRQFWRVVDSLQQDVDPPERVWEELFATPAYRYLTEEEDKAELFRRAFATAFRPRAAGVAEPETPASDAPFVAHYRRVLERRKELMAFEAELAETEALPAVVQEVAAFLPEGVTERHAPPLIAFAIFAPDAYGRSLIVVDMLCALESGGAALLAHEAFHYYSAKVSRLRKVPEDDPAHWLVHAVEQMQQEGIADLIDKPRLFARKRDLTEVMARYAREYEASMARADATLARIDALLARADATPGDLATVARSIWDALPFAGHPQGFAMANVIVEFAGKDRLIGTVDNPFAFVRLYNEVAARGGHHELSAAAMRVLDGLETRWVSPLSAPGR